LAKEIVMQPEKGLSLRLEHGKLYQFQFTSSQCGAGEQKTVRKMQLIYLELVEGDMSGLGTNKLPFFKVQEEGGQPFLIAHDCVISVEPFNGQ